MFKEISWSEEFTPRENCRYNHVIGSTPLGNFLITWKAWSDSPEFCVNETPFQVDISEIICEYTLDGAKDKCQVLYTNMLLKTLGPMPLIPLDLMPFSSQDRRGKIIKHKLGDDSYVITADYGTRMTAVRTVDITNFNEWLILDLGVYHEISFQ